MDLAIQGPYMQALTEQIVQDYIAELRKVKPFDLCTEDEVAAWRLAALRVLYTVSKELSDNVVLTDTELDALLGGSRDEDDDAVGLPAPSVLFAIAVGHLSGLSEVGSRSSDSFAKVTVLLARNLMSMMGSRHVLCVHSLISRIESEKSSERFRLSRDLHDELSSQLAIVHSDLEAADLYSTVDPAKVHSKVLDARTNLQVALGDMRRILAGLRRVEVGEPISGELTMFVSLLGGPALEVRVEGDEQRLPEHIRRELVVMACESLRNAITHGHPLRLRASAQVWGQGASVVIEDDGVGFDIDAESDFPSGFGIMSIRERAGELGGTVVFSRTCEGWTRVQIDVPLPEAA
ncbi:sensor histidine kinase [Millisia brevis]|uniref:sensor histidine kinase n=1 Tax=Millisia brevis TaxID=264148 RepID=UPI00082B01FB|nr:histidine kinase [Millisia brevis]